PTAPGRTSCSQRSAWRRSPSASVVVTVITWMNIARLLLLRRWRPASLAASHPARHPCGRPTGSLVPLRGEDPDRFGVPEEQLSFLRNAGSEADRDCPDVRAGPRR